MTENHFTESEEATFSALSLIVHLKNHFTESAEDHFSLKNC
jgi:hypothetical protein